VLQVRVGDELQSTCSPGVVDQHIDPAQPVRQRRHGLVVCDVGHNGGSADLVGQRIDPVFAARHHHHVKTKGRKGSGGCLADSGTGAGYHSNTCVSIG